MLVVPLAVIELLSVVANTTIFKFNVKALILALLCVRIGVDKEAAPKLISKCDNYVTLELSCTFIAGALCTEILFEVYKTSGDFWRIFAIMPIVCCFK